MKLGKTYFSGSITFDEGNNVIGPSSATFESITVSNTLNVTGNITGAATTASYVEFTDIANKPTLISSSNQLAGETVDGDLTVTGKLTAQEFHTEYVSGSIIYTSGSTKFGDSADDTHEVTGSLNLLGPMTYGGTGLTLLGQSSDGADNQAFFIGAGGAGSDTRGAYIWGRGNEATNGGKIQINAGNVSTGNIELYTGGSVRMFVSSSGRIGFGTSDPKTNLLSIRGLGAIDSNGNQGLVLSSNHYYDSGDKYIGNGYGSIISQDTGGTYAGHIRFQQAGLNSSGAGAAMTLSDSMVIDQSGNLQIATTAFSDSGDPRVTVGSKGYYYDGSGNGLGDFHIGDGTYGLSTGVALGGGGAGDVRIWTTGGSHKLIFGTGGGDRVYLKSNGYLGLGIYDPSHKLQVLLGAGDGTGLGLLNTSGQGLKIFTDTTASNADVYIQQGAAGSAMIFRQTTNERMRIDSSGRIGIGVTPSSIWSTSYDALQIGLGGSIYAHSSAGNAMKIGSNIVYEGTAPNYYDKYLSNSTATKYEQDAGTHAWYVAGSGTAGNAISWTEAMRIDSSGRVGIGTPGLTNTLHVHASEPIIRINSTLSTAAKGLYFTYNNTLYSRITHNANSGQLLITSGESGQTGYYMDFNVNGSNALRIGSDGNATFSKSDDMRISITDTGDSSTLVLRADATNEIYTNTNHDLQIYTNGNQNGQLYLKQSNGNVGIGTTSPQQKLHVRGSSIYLYNDIDTTNTYITAENSGAGNAGVRMKNNQGEWILIANDRLRVIDQDAGGTERMSILSNGNVGINQTSPSARLHISDTDGAAIIYQGTRRGKMIGKTIQRHTISNPKTDLFTINSYASSNSNLYAVVTVLFVSPTQDRAGKASAHFFIDGSFQSTPTVGSFTYEHQFNSSNISLEWDSTNKILKFVPDALTYWYYVIDVEYVAFDGASVTFNTAHSFNET